ncbi:TPA: hypothetical protein N0F65_009011 [Lagenidium giganteum]|uniref:HTH CENPB-type domain-containing protein n=1 Tax=Lagenidium giganteum TaxID=4803 RepID=A0AAV2YWQ9_9STRA|nr:TPA: hypothetical protein N0F65_009011 [Lagenidium giganteum]
MKSVASMEAAEKQMTEDMTSEMVEESTELEQDDKTNIVGRKRRAGANVSIDLQTKIRLIELAEEYQYDPKSSGRAKSDGPQSSKDQMSGIRLAAQFGLNKSTVSRILKRKEEFKKAYYKDNISGCSKHINKKSKFEKLNRLVENWFDVTREKKVGVSDTLIRDVGKRFAEELGIEDFRGSNGWVRSLRNRKENQARNMSLEALEREKLKKEAEAIERMRAFFPNGTNDMAAFFKDLAIFIEKDCGGAGGPGSFGDSPSSAAGNASNGTAASCFADQLDVTEEMKPDKETDESLRRRMVDSLRMWSHELLEVELTKMKRRLKPQVTPTASAASAALAPALGSLESMQPVATDADATASSTPRQTAIL